MLEMLQNSVEMFRPLNVMLSSRKELFQHVGVQLIILNLSPFTAISGEGCIQHFLQVIS